MREIFYCLYNIDPHLQASGIFCNKNIFNTYVTINKNVLSASLNNLWTFTFRLPYLWRFVSQTKRMPKQT